MRLAVAHGAGLFAHRCGRKGRVGGRRFVYTNGVSSLRDERGVMGRKGSGGLIHVSTLAVGRGLQVFF